MDSVARLNLSLMGEVGSRRETGEGEVYPEKAHPHQPRLSAFALRLGILSHEGEDI